MNAEGRLKKRIEHKLLQAGFDQAHATDELKNQILELFRAYSNASDENKAAVYTRGQKRVMEAMNISRTSSSNHSSG